MDMSNQDNRISALESGHHALRERVLEIKEHLTARIDATDSILKEMRAEQKDMRQDVKSDLGNLQSSISRIENDSLKTWPPAAVEALREANSRSINSEHTKGILIGAVVTLVVALCSTSILLWLHW